MVKTITIDPNLADRIEKEVISIRPRWQFYKITTPFYDKSATPEERSWIDAINTEYGPIVDTQRFTDSAFMYDGSINLEDLRKQPKSYLNKTYANSLTLVDYLMAEHIPPNYGLSRMLVNMQTKRSHFALNAVHPDVRLPGALTVLYYVNDSDGDTYFFEKDKCIKRTTPIKGTGALYHSTTFHAGSVPTEHENRVVINFVFFPNSAIEYTSNQYKEQQKKLGVDKLT